MEKVLLCPNLNLSTAANCVEDIVKHLNEYGMTPMLCKDDADSLGIEADIYVDDMEQLLDICEAAIAIGGDGTMFHLARSLMDRETPILGINSGRLGFLSQLEARDLTSLKKLKTNDFDIENRMVLRITLLGNGINEVRYAINDAVISRSHLGRAIDIEILCEEYHIGDYRADGIIFSTPTGSTAYSLSAGGPIMDPAVDAIIMTPICPHLLAGRSMVFSGEKTVTAKPVFPDDNMKLGITIDGIPEDIGRVEEILIEKSSRVSKFICFKDRSFYKTLNQKLKLRG